MQDKDFEWFIENYNALYEKYGCCFLVIKNMNILGVYKSFDEAVDTTLLTEEIGSFIVQECNGDESAYTIQIASMTGIDRRNHRTDSGNTDRSSSRKFDPQDENRRKTSGIRLVVTPQDKIRKL